MPTMTCSWVRGVGPVGALVVGEILFAIVAPNALEPHATQAQPEPLAEILC